MDTATLNVTIRADMPELEPVENVRVRALWLDILTAEIADASWLVWMAACIAILVVIYW